ncbi:MAG: twin-arginine translocation signal domain-containing protein, partial [Bacteroidales bacterium]|nr:twin-arginine translocation signal domain-containing protein [Bacteroidales bacterium]
MSDTMKDQQEDEVVKGNPVSRRNFIKKVETVVAGGTILGLSGAVLFRPHEGEDADYYWQIDHTKCIQCERCETECILPVSA